MSKITFSVPTNYEVTTEMLEMLIADIEYAGLEWIEDVQQRTDSVRGVVYDFTEVETEEVYTLSLPLLAETLKKIISHEVVVNHVIRDNIAQWGMDWEEADQFDFDCVDVLIQVAFFGEIVYG